jgi:hypothetical protein
VKSADAGAGSRIPRMTSSVRSPAGLLFTETIPWLFPTGI